MWCNCPFCQDGYRDNPGKRRSGHSSRYDEEQPSYPWELKQVGMRPADVAKYYDRGGEKHCHYENCNEVIYPPSTLPYCKTHIEYLPEYQETLNKVSGYYQEFDIIAARQFDLLRDDSIVISEILDYIDEHNAVSPGDFDKMYLMNMKPLLDYLVSEGVLVKRMMRRADGQQKLYYALTKQIRSISTINRQIQKLFLLEVFRSF